MNDLKLFKTPFSRPTKINQPTHTTQIPENWMALFDALRQKMRTSPISPDDLLEFNYLRRVMDIMTHSPHASSYPTPQESKDFKEFDHLFKPQI